MYRELATGDIKASLILWSKRCAGLENNVNGRELRGDNFGILMCYLPSMCVLCVYNMTMIFQEGSLDPYLRIQAVKKAFVPWLGGQRYGSQSPQATCEHYRYQCIPVYHLLQRATADMKICLLIGMTHLRLLIKTFTLP